MNILLKQCKYQQKKYKILLINYILIKHPEGGYYKETDRSPFTTSNKNGDKRDHSTLIYYLLTPYSLHEIYHGVMKNVFSYITRVTWTVRVDLF